MTENPTVEVPYFVEALVKLASPYLGSLFIDGKVPTNLLTLRDKIALFLVPELGLLRLEDFPQASRWGISFENFVDRRLNQIMNYQF